MVVRILPPKDLLRGMRPEILKLGRRLKPKPRQGQLGSELR
jgi:hypothetical protein